jgi:CHRD domain
MRRWVALAAILMTAAACGSPGTGASTSPSPSSTVSGPSSAALVFKLNAVGTATAKGTATLTTTSTSLTVELKITGLLGASIHVSHIHNGSCASRGGIKFALNPVIADDQGMADSKTTVQASYPPKSGSWYVVVHVGPDMTGTNAQYLLCGNLFK